MERRARYLKLASSAIAPDQSACQRRFAAPRSPTSATAVAGSNGKCQLLTEPDGIGFICKEERDGKRPRHSFGGNGLRLIVRGNAAGYDGAFAGAAVQRNGAVMQAHEALDNGKEPTPAPCASTLTAGRKAVEHCFQHVLGNTRPSSADEKTKSPSLLGMSGGLPTFGRKIHGIGQKL